MTPVRPVQQKPVVPARRQAPAAPGGRAAEAVAPPQAARPATAPARKPEIEADVRLRFEGPNGADANGAVTIQSAFLLRLLKHVLRNPKRFAQVAIHFDPQTKTYVADAKVKLLGMWVPVTGRAHPASDGGVPTIAFDELAIKWGPGGKWRFSPGLLERKVTALVAEELAKDGFLNTVDAKQRKIRLEPNALLHEIDALPHWAALNTRDTKFEVSTAANGDVRIALQTGGQAPVANGSTRSDISVTADDAALTAIALRALAPSYDVRTLKVAPNKVSLSGQVELKPVTDVANGIRVLALILSQGRVGRQEVAPVMGTLDLEVAMEGTKILITPSLKPAAKQLAETLVKAGIAATVDGRTISADLGPWLDGKGLKNQRIQALQGTLEARFEIDIDSRIKNPNLRRPDLPPLQRPAADSARA